MKKNKKEFLFMKHRVYVQNKTELKETKNFKTSPKT